MKKIKFLLIAMMAIAATACFTACSDDEEESNEPEAAFGVGSTKYVTAEFEKIRLEKATKKAQERTGKIPGTTSTDDDDEDDEEPMSTLDKIDQLIMELSDDANKQ